MYFSRVRSQFFLAFPGKEKSALLIQRTSNVRSSVIDDTLTKRKKTKKTCISKILVLKQKHSKARELRKQKITNISLQQRCPGKFLFGLNSRQNGKSTEMLFIKRPNISVAE